MLEACLMNAAFLLPPENAHKASILALKTGLVSHYPIISDPRIMIRIFDLDFPSPLGLAAGYDKNAEVPDEILHLGFGFTEVGTVTPKPQSGNPQPRLFRLVEDEAVINRLGFNNQGHEAMLGRMQARQNNPGIVGINIGANKDSADFVADYEAGIEKFYPYASYFMVNVSSPNTPGLRDLQMGDALTVLLNRVDEKSQQLADIQGLRKPVILKIAPDLDAKQMDEIAKAVTKSNLDGLAISNTTLARPLLKNQTNANEAGGLSGKPLFEISTRILAEMRNRLGDRLPMIGIGGVANTADVISKLQAGASLVQLYTSLVYGGPGLPSRIVSELKDYLEKNNIAHVSELTGSQTGSWLK